MNTTDNEFMKTMVMIIGGLVGFMVIIIIAANVLPAISGEETSADPMVQAATEERIQPIARVNVGDAAPVVTSGPIDAKAIYQATCFACHGTGAAGAPKLGDSAAWNDRIAQGMSTLVDHAINGFKGMPPKGGNAGLSDDAIKAVVQHMVDGSK